jgi:hypothetical protein
LVFEQWEEKIKQGKYWVPLIGGLGLAAIGTAPKRLVRVKHSTKKMTAIAGLGILFGVGALLAFDPPANPGPNAKRPQPIPVAPGYVQPSGSPIPVPMAGIQAFPTRQPYYG